MKTLLFTTIAVFISISVIQAQKIEKNKEQTIEKVYVKLKEGVKPDVYVDGKKFDFPMELIDQSKITSIFIVKGDKAIKKYNAPNGVVLIKTKITKTLDASEIKISNNDILTSKNKPKIIIDGKIADKKNLDKLKPEQIEKMEVVKGKEAIKKYNAPNGVIIITTKNKKE